MACNNVCQLVKILAERSGCVDADNAKAVAAASSTSLTNSIKTAVAKAQASATASNGQLFYQPWIAFPV